MLCGKSHGGNTNRSPATWIKRSLDSRAEGAWRRAEIVRNCPAATMTYYYLKRQTAKINIRWLKLAGTNRSGYGIPFVKRKCSAGLVFSDAIMWRK
jgi:hypothetical protein